MRKQKYKYTALINKTPNHTLSLNELRIWSRLFKNYSNNHNNLQRYFFSCISICCWHLYSQLQDYLQFSHALSKTSYYSEFLSLHSLLDAEFMGHYTQSYYSQSRFSIVANINILWYLSISQGYFWFIILDMDFTYHVLCLRINSTIKVVKQVWSSLHTFGISFTRIVGDHVKHF